MEPEDIKKLVKEKYGQIAGQSGIKLDTGDCCTTSEQLNFPGTKSRKKGY